MKNFFIIVCFILFFFQLSAQVNVFRDAEMIALEKENIKISFSSTIYKLLQLQIDSKELLSTKDIVTHPWELTYKGPNGENPILKPQNGYYKGVEVLENKDFATLTFIWEMVLIPESTSAVRMMVTLRKDSDLIEWNLEADLPTGWAITYTDFPRISLKKPENAKAILSAGWGSEYPLNNGTALTSRYPSGTGTMQLVLVHNGSSCIYYATQDKDASDKQYKVESTDKMVNLFTQTITSEGWSPKEGGVFCLPWTTVLGYCSDSWEVAATKWYRPFTYTTVWGSKTLESRNIPAWLFHADVWLRPMGVSGEIMQAVKEAIAIYGKGIGLHWYYWHNHPFDTKYPEYFPTKEGFVEMVKEVNTLGGHVTPYINGRLWDPATESYKSSGGSLASCRKADGTLYTEVYSSKVLNTVTCPASPTWQKIQKDLIKRIQDEIGTSGVYVDQVAAAPAEPCWAENHNHPKGGGEFWHQAYRDLYKDIRSGYLKKGNILTSEENAECYIDLFDMFLIVNSPIRHSTLVPLFPLVYSDRVITSAFAYTPANLQNGSFRFLNMMSLLWGAQLGWVDPLPLMKAKEEAEFLKEMMDFRKKHHDYFNGGRLIREIIPTGDNPERIYTGYTKSKVVRGAEWQNRKTKKNAVFLVNIDNSPHEVVLPNGKVVYIKAKECLLTQ